MALISIDGMNQMNKSGISKEIVGFDETKFVSGTMRKITQEELKIIVENHTHWLREDVEGWEKMRADLEEANLRGADLKEANLKEANLTAANLRSANLAGAFLFGTNLRSANLTSTNLKEASLKKADLRGADLRGAKDVPFIPTVCPDEGSFTAYKKASGKIVVLRIPRDAKRFSATGRKCRCNKAKVLRIENLDGSDSGLNEIESDFDDRFIYRIGETVKVHDFDENRWNECSTGIHFFINRQEAVEW